DWSSDVCSPDLKRGPAGENRCMGMMGSMDGADGTNGAGVPVTGRADAARDRDSEGRARNARPRDGLGRPLPYGAEGVPRQPEGVVRPPAQSVAEAQRLLDEGKPFHAHEVFEDAW